MRFDCQLPINVLTMPASRRPSGQTCISVLQALFGILMRLVAADPSYPNCEATVEGLVRRIFVFTLAFFLLVSSLTAQQNSAAKQGPLVLTHVAVIDLARGQAQPDRTVVILDGYI